MWETVALRREVWGVSMSENSKTPTSAAERMRRYRKRQRRGQRVVRVQIGPIEIDGLIDKRYLAPDDKENTEALEFAVGAYVSDSLLYN